MASADLRLFMPSCPYPHVLDICTQHAATPHNMLQHSAALQSQAILINKFLTTQLDAIFVLSHMERSCAADTTDSVRRWF
jgi:hypothetical protein